MAVVDLATVEQVKGYLGITSVADDALLERLVGSASAYIQKWLNRDLGSDIYIASMDGNNSDTMLLPNYPVQSVTSLTIDGQAIPLSSGPLNKGYAFDDNRIVLRGYRFTGGLLNVEVTYTAGYADGEIPADVTQACIEMIAMRYREKDRIGLSSKGLAGETTAYSQKDMADSTRHILNQYRRVAPL